MKYIIFLSSFMLSFNVTFSQTGDTVSLVSGLKYIVIKEGTGTKAQNGLAAEVNYRGYLTDGDRVR